MAYPEFPCPDRRLGVLGERSEDALRQALARALPELARCPIVLSDVVGAGDPVWCRTSARVGRRHVVKFAWRTEAAPRLWYEGRVMGALAASPAGALLPPLHHFGHDPLLLVTRVVPGVPLTRTLVAGLAAPGTLHDSLAEALVAIHDPRSSRALAAAGVRALRPTPQATTEDIRRRLRPRLSPAQGALVGRWCGWVDDVLRRPAAGPGVALHGDLHGYNALVAPRGRLTCLLDWEGVSVGDPHFDFRYLPDQAPPHALLMPVVLRYEARSGRTVDAERLLAWHMRTVLGDALWRTAAGVPLPDGGTVESWIVGLSERTERLADWRRISAPAR